MKFTAMVSKCNCGCQKGLSFRIHEKGRMRRYSMSCQSCSMNSGLQKSLSECIATWNVAMGPTAIEDEVSWTIPAGWEVGCLSTVRCMVD